MEIDILKIFTQTDTPFMLLFVSLFFYVIKTSRDREADYHNIMENKIEKISQDQSIMLNVWKILLEKEMEERK
jgi:BhlA-like holin